MTVIIGKSFVKRERSLWSRPYESWKNSRKKKPDFYGSLLELDGTTRINAELAEGLIESMYLYGDGKLEINFGFKGVVEHE